MVTRRIAYLLTGLALSACRGQANANAQQSVTAAPPPHATPSRAIDAQRRTAIVDASERVSPSVVSIHVILPVARQISFFGIEEETPQGFGTGFVFRADGNTGYIITNNHVIENATQITVTLAVMGRTPMAPCSALTSVTDIAVVKITKPGLCGWLRSAVRAT